MSACVDCNARNAVPPRRTCKECRNAREKAARVARRDALAGQPCIVDGCSAVREVVASQVRPYCSDHYREYSREWSRAARRASGAAERVPVNSMPEGLTVSPDQKWCRGCATVKSRLDFYKSNDKKDGLQTRCKSCDAISASERYNATPEHYREISRRSALKNRVVRTYQGFESREDYETKRAAASCGICGASHDQTPMVFDHDHASGADRDWLCGGCNKMLGHAKDSPERLRAAAEYLERYSSGGGVVGV